MNLQQSNQFQQKNAKQSQTRKGVLFAIVLCGLLVVILIIMFIMLKYQDSITEKFFIDGVQTSKLNGVYKDFDGVTYVKVKQFAEALGYTYEIGQYNQYNDNADSCYVQNDFELVAIDSGTTSYQKYIILEDKGTFADIEDVTSSNVKNNKDEGYNETFNLDNEIIFDNDEIYVPLDACDKMFNLQKDWQQYRKYVYTLEYLYKIAEKRLVSAGYEGTSSTYENLRAILDDYMVCEKDEKYGIISVNSAEEVLSCKYDSLLYVQNMEKFYCTITDGAKGLLSPDGKYVINTNNGYTDISLLDEKNELYEVTKDKEVGICNGKGEEIVYTEYDSIGYKTSSFKQVNDIDNSNIFFEKVIPVEKDGLYGLVNTEGELILDLNYSSFGYIAKGKTTSGNELSVLLIPEEVGIQGIVICYNDDDTYQYGIYDVNKEQIIIPAVLDKVYAKKENNVLTYYFEYGGSEVNLKEYLIEQGLNNVSVETESEDEEESSLEISGNSTSTNTTNETKQTTSINTVENDSKEVEIEE